MYKDMASKVQPRDKHPFYTKVETFQQRSEKNVMSG